MNQNGEKYHKESLLLMIPGPTPIPPLVLEALACHPIPHRSPEFCAIVQECNQMLKEIFLTRNDVFIYTSSGTGAMCAALENLINPGDSILCLVIGIFGKRFVNIAKTRGANIDILSVEAGESINPKDLEMMLQKKRYKLVTLTHSETSSGAANDIKTLCKIIKQYNALIVVDGITSLCAMECRMDDWGIDVLISGSQKGFMLPPGLAFLSASQKAIQESKNTLYKSFYFDFLAYQEALQRNTTPYTPAITLILGLHCSLKEILKIGIENLNRLHRTRTLALRAALKAMNLKLLVEDDEKASYAVTAVYPPDGITVKDIRAGFKNRNIVVANGQGELENKIFRIGTLGYVNHEDLVKTMNTLEEILIEFGYPLEVGLGLKTLQARL